MEASLTNKSIATNISVTSSEVNENQVIKKRSDSLEFLSGVFYIFRKVFLLK